MRLGLIVSADGKGGSPAVVLYPTVNKPERVAKAFSKDGSSLINFGLGGRLTSELAEDGINHASRMGMTSSANQLDGFREGCVGRDAV